MNTLPPQFLRKPVLRFLLIFTRPRLYLLTFAFQIYLVAHSRFVAFGLLTAVDLVHKTFWRTVENLRTTWRFRITEDDQRRMNSRAAAYLRRLNDGESSAGDRPVFLFLRSFAMDKLVELDPADSRRRPFIDPFHDDPKARGLRRIALETALARDLNERGTTIALQNADETYSLGSDAYIGRRGSGNTLFHLGPGEVLLDPTRWFEQFARVADHCDLIVSIPIVYCTGPVEQNGTMRELQYLVENDLIGKCIFVMPPEQYFRGYSVYRPFGSGRASESVHVGKNISELWNDSLPHLQAIGLTLPRHDAGANEVGLIANELDQVMRFEPDEFRGAFFLTALRVLRGTTRLPKQVSPSP